MFGGLSSYGLTSSSQEEAAKDPQDSNEAEESPEPITAGLWGFASSTFSTIKQQSASVVGVLKEDFSEFQQSLREENKDSIDNIANTVKLDGNHNYENQDPEIELETKEKTENRPQSDEKLVSTGPHTGIVGPPPPAVEGGAQVEGDEWSQTLQTGLEGLEDLGDQVWKTTLSSVKILPSLWGGDDDDTQVTQPTEKSATNILASIPVSDGPSSHIISKIAAMQADISTYTTDCDGDQSAYENFMQQFDEDLDSKYSNGISETMENETVSKYFEELVPDVVSERIFWVRFFWRVQQLQEEEDRRRQLVQRVEEDQGSEDPFNLSWDDDENDLKSPSESPRVVDVDEKLEIGSPVAAESEEEKILEGESLSSSSESTGVEVEMIPQSEPTSEDGTNWVDVHASGLDSSTTSVEENKHIEIIKEIEGDKGTEKAEGEDDGWDVWE